MNRVLVVVMVIALPLVAFFLTQGDDPLLPIPGFGKERPLVFFADQVPLRVEVVSSGEALARGLSGRTSLGPTEGMLFVFKEADYHGMWMKDMRIPIDIIWIDEQFKVIHIEKNVLPDTYPKIFEPASRARFVIETNGNYADSFKIRVGDSVTLPEDVIPSDLR